MSFFSKFFGGPQTATVEEVREQLAAGALILDVRTADEFAQDKITNAINVPVQVLSQYTTELKKQNKPFVVYCRSGVRAATAINILNNAGIKAVNAGGIADLQAMM